MIIRILGISLFVLLFNTVKADSPTGKGRTIILTGHSFLYSVSGFDNSWKKIKFLENNSFFTQFSTISIIHGINRSTDILFNVPYIQQRFINQLQTSRISGIGDVSIGLSKHFTSFDFKRNLTIKGLFTIPMYRIDTSFINSLSLGYGSRAFTFEANYSMPAGKATYLLGQINYANYFDNLDGPQQFLYSVTYGKRVDFYNSFSITFSHQTSFSSNKKFDPSIVTNTNFTNGRLSLGFGKRITRTTIILLQGSTFVYGQNTVGGLGGSLSFIVRLP